MRLSGWWDRQTAVGILCATTLLSLHWFQDVGAQRRSHHYSRYRRTSHAPGPNMCKVQEVIGTGQRFFTHCVAKHLKVICERPTFDRWECCPGYRRKGRSRGCREEKSLGNLLDTADELNLNVFHQYVNQSRELSKELSHFGAYTVFAPSDEAIKEATERVKNDISDPGAGLLKYHVAPGRLNISIFRQKNQEFVTLFNGERVRVNKYAYGVATVNCARIVRPDELATNGIIHVIDKVISPSDMNVSLAERLFSDDQFSQFQLAVFVSGMVNTLKKKTSSFTVLAPTNQAFAKLPSDIVDRILTDADTAEKVVKRHIVNGVYCADAIVVSIGLKTLDGARLLFRCKRDGLMVNEATVTEQDSVASNGVLHAINTVLLPDTVKKASELMYDMHLDKFLSLARMAGLNDTFDDDDDVTIFSPSDTAVQRLPSKYLAALSKEPLKMQRLLKYHMVKGRLTENSLIGDTSLTTHAIDAVKIKVNVFRHGISVDKATLGSYPRQCRNAVIHKVDNVLIPPEQTFDEIINTDPDLSMFAQYYRSLGLGEELANADSYTLIAPTNRAFNKLDPLSWRRVKDDPARLRTFLNRHVINKLVLKCSIPERGIYGITSRQGDETEFEIGRAKRVTINKHARALSDDTLAVNGVLYKVDHVLPCTCEKFIRTKRGQYIISYRYRRTYY